MASILSVPGLGSHPIDAFKEKNGDHVWIRDSLPKDIPSARILVYGYDTTTRDADDKYSISDLAMAFLDSVTAFRAATKVFITVNHIYSPANGKCADEPQATYLRVPWPRRSVGQGGLPSLFAL